MKYTFTTQFTFDFKNSDKHKHSDEVITIPDDSFTIRELFTRSVNGTMPELSSYGKEYDDDDISLDDELLFHDIKDLNDLQYMKDLLDQRIFDLKQKEYLDKEKQQETKKSPENKANEPKTED